MRARLRSATAIAAAAAACAGDPVPLVIAGDWSLTEAFADEVHHVSCEGQGTMTVAQPSVSDGGTAPAEPGPAFTGTAGIANDCTSLDGPFSYFGDVGITDGTITPGAAGSVRWDAAVNAAACEYQGTVRGDGTYGTDMEGTLTCVLADAGVTFNFVGAWAARNWRSAWCAERPTVPGCAPPEP